MADLSKIRIPNGTEYNLKDAQARADIESLNGSLALIGGVIDAWIDGYAIYASGLVENSAFKWSGYIPISNLKIPIYYKLGLVKTTYIGLFDSNHVMIDTIRPTSTATTVTICEGIISDFGEATYIGFCTRSTSEDTLSYCNLSYASFGDGIVTTAKIADSAVTSEKTNFMQKCYSANLFDINTMLTMDAWAYTSAPTTSGVVSIISNSSAYAYAAIKVPVPTDAEHITIKTSTSNAPIFSYYFTDEYSKTISYEYNVNYPTTDGITLTVPTGTAYLYVTFKTGSYVITEGTKLIVSATDAVVQYVPYEEWLEIPDLKYEIEDTSNYASLNTPAKFELVVGDTFELFYKGIVKAAKWEAFDVVVECSKGKGFERKYVYTPVDGDVGTHNLVVKLYDQNQNLLDSKTISLVVKAKASSPESETIILYVSDSLATGGTAPGEFKRRLTASNGTPAGDGLDNITFIGLQYKSGVNYEGYGGWTFAKYNAESSSNAYMWITAEGHDKTEAVDQHSIYEDANGKQWKLETIEANQIKLIRVSSSDTLPSSGTLTWVSGGEHTSDIVYTSATQAAGNPFWDDTQSKVDFATYAARMGVNNIDYVYVLLGWNGAGATEEYTKEQVRTFLDNVLSAFPNCHIILLGIQVPARDGLAENYGSSANGTILAHYYEALSWVFTLNDWYADIAAESEYADNVSFVNVAGQFDTDNNMMTVTEQVNTRNSKTVERQSNGVHPAAPGYYQIADACWRDFHHQLQN